MDGAKRRLLEEHLILAERHVADGERLLERQRRIVEDRQREGLDVELSTDLLMQMEELQRMHIADRDRLRNELATGQ